MLTFRWEVREVLAVKRRDFIMLLGGAAAAWPLAARAPQGERGRRIGGLMNAAADDPDGPTRLAAFQQVLHQSGWSRSMTCQFPLLRCGDVLTKPGRSADRVNGQNAGRNRQLHPRKPWLPGTVTGY